MRLQKCLVGPAKEAVVSMLIYPDDVPNVLNELEFRFGRPDILVKWQLSKLQQLPTIAEHKPEQIVTFSTKVRNVVAFLKSAKCDQHLSNRYPTIKDFSAWLSDLARVVCLMPAANTNIYKHNVSSANPRRLMHIQDESPAEPMKCFHCGGNHSIARCEVFKTDIVRRNACLRSLVI
ncbi:PREDICTED: uncharacterized protein LOC108356356 [Rhagoletis zephyria]|uniref:uncharacterized protein LOC108356356 n=1 Tax=Rhagoletis zephyria TaxID=28612 RepID=UPI0008118622|nr:PREDICTED: uncharacterized protein LOC108356356 [Rhagoletis zephyria]